MKALLLSLILMFIVIPAKADNAIPSFTGYLVDRDAVRMTNKNIDMKSTQAAYSRQLALRSDAVFALVSNGKLYELDTAGNKLAKSLITNSHNDQPLFVMIRGQLADEKIAVEQLSDISVQNF
ncbi:MAG: hypothetical protein K2Y22_02295 [Candidatus Obscuribacterales bacterium]|nr:hypothetical protein [Candidatus Obscuribacterales bacterium]